jgi:hypothetical protein
VHPIAQRLPIHPRQPRGIRPIHPVEGIGDRDQPGADPAVILPPGLPAQFLRTDVIPDH